MAPVTQILLITTVAAYFVQLAALETVTTWFALWPLRSGGYPADVGFMPWQLVTYALLHSPSNPMHLIFNMLGLYMFGSDIERVFGPRRYAIYYFVCVVTAGLAQLAVSMVTNAPPYPTVGASGGVFGLLLAFGLYFPRRMVMLIFPPIPMPAWLFVTLYGLLELYLGVTGTSQGIAHFAHLGGMLGGYIMIRGWRARSPFR